MKKAIAFLGASLVGAGAASLCCSGPLVATLLGVGSFGAATVLEAWRPYLLSVTGVLLGAAFYFTSRKGEVRCADGTCVRRSAPWWNKALLWIVAVLVVLVAAFPYYAGRLSAVLNRSGNGPIAVNPSQAAEQGAKVRMSVTGMTCPRCAAAVEAALKKLAGVRSAAVNFERGEAVIEFDPAQVQIEHLVEVVKESGSTMNHRFAVETVAVAIRVQGMTCAGCAEAIRRALAKQEGVKSVEVSLEEKRVVVIYDPAKITVKRLVESIARGGFEATL